MRQPLSHHEEHKRRKRKARLIKFSLVFFLLLAIFVGLILLSRIQKFRVSTVELTGGTLVTQDEVSSATKDFLSGNYFWFFPKNNDLLYSRGALQNFLKDKFKRIDSISVSLKGFKTLEISITERNLNSLWCDGTPDSDSSAAASADEHCYFMDEKGLIFSDAPYFSGDAYFKYYGLVSTSTPIGQQYIDQSMFEDLSGFITRAQSLSLYPIYLFATGDGQFTVGLANGGYIYISTEEPISKSADNLQALLGTISATATTTLNFDYIDLRFGNKLFYKLK